MGSSYVSAGAGRDAGAQCGALDRFSQHDTVRKTHAASADLKTRVGERQDRFMDRPITKRALRKAATRRSVIAAAREVFRTRGYDGATIAAIAGAAGVSPGTVLNAAATKIALLNAVMREDFERLGADCETLAGSLSGSPRETVAALLEQHLARHCADLDLMAAMLGHCWLGQGENFQEFYANLDLAWRPVRRVLDAAAAEGAIDASISRDTLVAFLQDAYLAVLRRCVSDGLDLFAASTLMRARLHMIFGAVACERG
jgi:AcrR family transcriptional regulator